MEKFSIMCDSPLMTRALEMFLKGQTVPYKQCDVVISDRPREVGKPTLVIGRDLPRPFSRSTLMLAMEKQKESRKISGGLQEIARTLNDEEPLHADDRIEEILRRFTREISEELMRQKRG